MKTGWGRIRSPAPGAFASRPAGAGRRLQAEVGPPVAHAHDVVAGLAKVLENGLSYAVRRRCHQGPSHVVACRLRT